MAPGPARRYALRVASAPVRKNHGASRDGGSAPPYVLTASRWRPSRARGLPLLGLHLRAGGSQAARPASTTGSAQSAYTRSPRLSPPRGHPPAGAGREARPEGRPPPPDQDRPPPGWLPTNGRLSRRDGLRTARPAPGRAWPRSPDGGRWSAPGAG